MRHFIDEQYFIYDLIKKGHIMADDQYQPLIIFEKIRHKLF